MITLTSPAPRRCVLSLRDPTLHRRACIFPAQFGSAGKISKPPTLIDMADFQVGNEFTHISAIRCLPQALHLRKETGWD